MTTRSTVGAVAKTIITFCVGVGGVRPTQPIPMLMSLLPRRLHTTPTGGGVWATRSVTIPLIPHVPFPNATTLSPTVLSPSYHPVPSPSELTAICALRNTPHLFSFFSFYISPSSDLQDVAVGVLKLFHDTLK